MFYRGKFDGWVGGILEATGLWRGADEMVRWWPAGSSSKWIRWAKDRRLKPPDAASIAVSITVLDQVERGEMAPDAARNILDAALHLAMTEGTPAGVAGVGDVAERLDRLTSDANRSDGEALDATALGNTAWGIARDVVELVLPGKLDLTGDASSAAPEAARVFQERRTSRPPLPQGAADQEVLYLEVLAYVAAWFDGTLQTGQQSSSWLSSRAEFLDAIGAQLSADLDLGPGQLASFERTLGARSQEYGPSLSDSAIALSGHLPVSDPLMSAMAAFAYVVAAVGESLKQGPDVS